MITVKAVKTKKEQKEFLDFPLKLYKNNPYYVPPLYCDEKKFFAATTFISISRKRYILTPTTIREK